MRAHLPAVLTELAQGFDPTRKIASVYEWQDADRAFAETAPKVVVERR